MDDARSHRQHHVTLSGQHTASQLSHDRFILYHQYRFRSTRQRPGRDGGCRHVERLVDAREKDLETRAFAKLAVNAEASKGQ